MTLDAKCAAQGASAGIALCIRTVIPSLFPYFVLTGLLIRLIGSGWNLSIPERLCGIPEGSGILLLTGFLGGYPAGAACVAQHVRIDGLNKGDAERMIAFCNNPGPAFIFGMAGSVLGSSGKAAIVWIILIMSSLLTAMVLPGKSAEKCRLLQRKSDNTVMHQALISTATVCGWIILFRMILAFADRWVLWLLPKQIQVLFAGILELSNGCVRLTLVENENIRLILLSVMLSLGGICVTMQTQGVIASAGLSVRKFVIGRLICCGWSLVLSAAYLIGFLPAAIAAIFFIQTAMILKNSSRNPVKSVV